MTETDALSVLLTDRKDIMKRVVQKAEGVMKIDRDTGETLLIAPRNKLSDRQVVAIYLLGQYFASHLRLVASDALSMEAVAEVSGLDKDSVTTTLSELDSEGLVENVKGGSYRLAYRALEGFGSLLEEVGHVSVSRSGSSQDNKWSAMTDGSFSGIDFKSVTDADAIVLSLNASKAFPSSESWLTADEIFRWTSEHGSFVRKETLKKYTLPQDPTVKRLITVRKVGRRREYQLSRKGFERVRRLLSIPESKQ